MVRDIDPNDTSDNTEALRGFNDYVRSDSRVVNVVCTIRDGVTLVRRA